eukprot:CAMPEP_0175920386 /NCGR_PEP_ID=MMETSP0108-20121206/12899_1 /TAXON_ID=195067 ORGANISM="Goniomonas pacifica, Strain CCMP1869" /NCGR_SAMPLE_ID=MMETSP0108 /ASSEMBLY_ACC=CAM_ASM_000204 /LENGTH=53 /DNA_ID=CAMNT_0017243095 /DNA_START=262 /DNA_END=423 /DNA_ORIENTATION=+
MSRAVSTPRTTDATDPRSHPLPATEPARDAEAREPDVYEPPRLTGLASPGRRM